MLHKKIKWLGCLLLVTAQCSVMATTMNDAAGNLLQDMVEKEQASSELVSLGAAYSAWVGVIASNLDSF